MCREPGATRQKEQWKSRGIVPCSRSPVHPGIGKNGKSVMLGKAHKWALLLASPAINQ